MYSFFGNKSLWLTLPHEIHWHWQSLDRCFRSEQHSLACVFLQHSLLESLWLQHRHSAPNEYERDIRSQATENTNTIIRDFLIKAIDLFFLKSLNVDFFIIMPIIKFVKY